MKKKTKNKLVVVPIIIVIALAIWFGSGMKFNIMQDGFVVQSISTTSVITKNTDLTGVWFLVNVALNGGGQSIVGTITPEQTKQLSGYQTNYPLELSASTRNEVSTYPILNTGEQVLKYWYVPNQGSISLGVFCNPAPVCPTGTNYEIEGYEKVLLFFPCTTTRYCVSQDQYGIKGNLDSPSTSFNTTLSLKVGDTFISKDISSRDGSVQFYAGTVLRATATWSGSLVTGDSAPEPSNFVAIASASIPITDSSVTTDWKIATATKWSNYQQGLTSAQAQLRLLRDGSIPISCNSLEDCRAKAKGKVEEAIALVNSPADTLLTASDTISANQLIQNVQDRNNGKVHVILTRYLTSPVLDFRIRADWLGVVIPEGRPKIISLSSEEFGSGETGTVVVTVENIGDGTGTFVAELLTCSPFTQKYSALSNMQTIPKGQRATYNVELTHGVTNADITKDCTIRVYDYNNPSAEDKGTVSVSMTFAKVCTPEKETIDGNCVYKCSFDGKKLNEVKCCDYGIKYIDNKYECNALPKNDTTKCKAEGEILGFNDVCCSGLTAQGGLLGIGKTCRAPPIDLTLLWVVLAGALAFLVAGGNAIRKKDAVGIAIAGIFGIIAALAVYWIFNNWLILLLGGIFGGVLLWVAGPAILVVVLILAKIVGAVKGK